jgi:hypothetical protein
MATKPSAKPKKKRVSELGSGAGRPPTRRRQSPASPGGRGASGQGTRNGNGQATKAAANKALGMVGSGKTRPVTIAQVQNDPSIKASDKKTIIAALRRKTEG